MAVVHSYPSRGGGGGGCKATEPPPSCRRTDRPAAALIHRNINHAMRVVLVLLWSLIVASSSWRAPLIHPLYVASSRPPQMSSAVVGGHRHDNDHSVVGWV